MKKSLFALAAVTAFAGAAQAQSSVTVYGLIDIGYIGGNQNLNAAGKSNNLNYNQFGASAQSTSRLGFRGNEDLGGGMSAFFNLETAITPNNGTFSDLQTRAANIGLAQKGTGRATIGTQNTVVTDAIGPTLTGQFSNIVGSMIFASRSGPTLGGTSSITQGNADGNTDAFTFRTGNTLKLQTERMAGFQVGAMAILNDSTSTQIDGPNGGYTGGKSNNNGWGVGASYLYKKFQLTAAYQSLKATNPFTATAAQAAAGTASVGAPSRFTVSGQTGTAVNGISGGTNVTDNQAYVGATYDFGIVKAYAGWIDRKVTSQINGSAYAKRTAQEIGVRGNWTPKIESYASIGNGRITTFGTNEPTANINGWQIGSNYILSKRTNLYAIYGMSGTSGVSNTTTGANQSFKASGYALGMRHTF